MEGVTPLRYSVVPFADKGSVLGVAVSVRPLAVKGTPFAVGCGQIIETAEGFVVALRLWALLAYFLWLGSAPAFCIQKG